MKSNDRMSKFNRIMCFLFFVYLLIYYIYGSDSENVKFSELILILFSGIEIIRIVQSKKIKYSFPNIIIYAFSIYCFISSIWAINPNLSLKKSQTLFILATFLLVVYNFFIDMKNSEEIILKIIMYSGIVFSIYVVSYYGVDSYFSKIINGERVGAEIDNVNAIGLETAISFIIAIFYALYSKKKFYIALSIIPLIVALGTGSRKVLILIVLTTIMLFILKKEEKINILNSSKKIFAFCVFIAIFIIITKMPFFTTIFNRFNSMINIITGKGKIDSSTEVRNMFIKEGFNVFIQKPLFGIGVNNSGYITLPIVGKMTYLHNNYIELLACTGIIGFLLYYYTFFYIIYYCIKQIHNKRNNYINIVLAIYLINLVLDYGKVSYYSKSTYIYILLGLIVVDKIKKQEKMINKQCINSQDYINKEG